MPVENPILNREKLYNTAVSFLGTDASPMDEAPDMLACADSVEEIHFQTFGEYISGSKTLSTLAMWRKLLKDSTFEKIVTEPMKGDIVISPTGTSRFGGSYIGHVGIVGDANKVMSNSSKSGKFEQNYTVLSWKNSFGVKRGFPVYFFRKIG